MGWLGLEIAEPAGPPVAACGILSTTPIATPLGWRPAGSLLPGASVLTFDEGVQPVEHAATLQVGDAPAHLWPLLVPAWAMDNRDDIVLLPEQKVLVEADIAEDLYGCSFGLVPALALEGWRGIARMRPPPSATAVQFAFARPAILYASRGVLLSCPGDPRNDTDWREAAYASFTLAQARHLVACLMAEETGAALQAAWQPLEGFSG
jgi:hypothetical protein